MPEAILLEDVEQLGQRGSVVEVSKGYLRNYLQPRKLAQPATKSALAAAQQMIAAAERAREQAAQDSQALALQLGNTVLTIARQAGDDGRLFGSVTNRDISDQLKKDGIEIDHRWVQLESAVKALGKYETVVRLAAGVTAALKFWGVGQDK